MDNVNTDDLIQEREKLLNKLDTIDRKMDKIKETEQTIAEINDVLGYKIPE